MRQAEDTRKKYDRIEEIDFEGGEIDLYFHVRIQKDLPVSRPVGSNYRLGGHT